MCGADLLQLLRNKCVSITQTPIPTVQADKTLESRNRSSSASEHSVVPRWTWTLTPVDGARAAKHRHVLGKGATDGIEEEGPRTFSREASKLAVASVASEEEW